MNRVFRVIWNKSLGRFDVASELSRGVAKSASSSAESADNSQKLFTLNIVTIAVAASLLLLSKPGIAADNGVIASGTTVTVPEGTAINTDTAGVSGLQASAGGSITGDNLTITTSGQSAQGLYTLGAGSTITLTNSTIETQKGFGIWALSGSNINATNVDITTMDNNATAIAAGGAGTVVNMTTGNITTSGAGAYALEATNNGKIIASGLTINTQGDALHVMSGTSSLSLSDSTVTTAGNGLVLSQGQFSTDNVAMTLTGDNTTAVNNQFGTNVSLKDTQIALNATGQTGINSALSAMTVDNLTVTGAHSATGILGGNGSVSGNAVNINVGSVDDDNVSRGLSLSQGASFTLTGSQINAAGNNDFGLIATSGTPSLTLTDSQLTAAQGTAIKASGVNTSLTVNASNTTLSGKTLLAGGSTGDTVALAAINATNGSVLAGDVTIDSTTTQNSTLSLDNSSWQGSSTGLNTLSLNNGSQWTVTGDSDLNSLTLNNSTLAFSNSDGAFKTLTVNGDYAGTNGTLMMNAALGADGSASDKLHVTGNTSGNTDVVVTNAGGSGAQTINGIELITVDGTSDGSFTQKGRIVAGAYDYNLVRGTGSKDKNWLLESNASPVTPPPDVVDPVTPPGVVDPVTPPGVVDPVTPPGVVDPDKPAEIVDPVLPVKPAKMIVRPEAASYAANQALANTLFSQSIQLPRGETQYVDPLTGEHRSTSLWMTNTGGHTRFSDSSGQLKTQTNRYVLQIGGDVISEENWRVGVMAGYADANSNSRSSVTGYRSKANIHGYNAGLYGTWEANPQNGTGLWVDGSTSYSWFDNSVTGDDLGSENYKSSGMTASVATGYAFQLSESPRIRTFITPKVQATWMGVSADDHKEGNGTTVRAEGDNNLQTRVGVRASAKSFSALDDTTGRRFEPFIEANWVHNTETFGSSLNGVSVSQRGAQNMAEVAAGVEANLNQRVSLSANFGQQIGDKGYSDSTATLGLKVNF